MAVPDLEDCDRAAGAAAGMAYGERDAEGDDGSSRRVVGVRRRRGICRTDTFDGRCAVVSGFVARGPVLAPANGVFRAAVC